MRLARDAHVLRVAIAGIAAARQEIEAVSRHPGTVIAGAADHDPVMLRAFRERFSVPVFGSVEELCASDAADAIFVGTPTQFHQRHALAALQASKHVLLAKPMALTLEDAEALVTAAERSGVYLVVGHTQAFEEPVRAMRALVQSGELGRLRMINSWYFTDWIYRGRNPEELDTSQGGGVVYRQAAHQMDILRYIGGGLVRSVRATTGIWDAARPTEGAYAAFLDFEDGVAATAVFSGYDHFPSAEIAFGIGEGGRRTDGERHASARAALQEATATGEELALKKARRSGSGRGTADAEQWQPFYGLTVVSCERGDVRQSPEGLLIYGDTERREMVLPTGTSGRDRMVDELYQAVVSGRPPTHDGRWALATLEACLALQTSSRERREVRLQHQVRVRDQ